VSRLVHRLVPRVRNPSFTRSYLLTYAAQAGAARRGIDQPSIPTRNDKPVPGVTRLPRSKMSRKWFFALCSTNAHLGTAHAIVPSGCHERGHLELTRSGNFAQALHCHGGNPVLGNNRSSLVGIGALLRPVVEGGHDVVIRSRPTGRWSPCKTIPILHSPQGGRGRPA
jgi:hypothetical protein